MRHLWGAAVGVMVACLQAGAQCQPLWRREGPSPGLFGLTMAVTPDVNGDGRHDLLAAAPYETLNGQHGVVRHLSGAAGTPLGQFTGFDNWSASGTALAVGDFGYGVPMIAAGAPLVGPSRGEVNLFFLSDCTVFGGLMSGLNPGDRMGSSLLSADINGNGVVDLIVGSGWNYSVICTDTGDFYSIVHGVDNRFSPVLHGVLPDENGDGRAELIVGHPEWNDGVTELGQVQVISPALDGVSSHVVRRSALGQIPVGHFGKALVILPDRNGDGVDELLVGAPACMQPWACDQRRGTVSLLSGATMAEVGTIQSPADGGGFGFSLAAVGDQDGDGVIDIAVGAPGGVASSSVVPVRGCVYVVSGATLTVMNVLLGPLDSGFGAALGVLDADGDGRQDLAVGAPSGGDQAGSVEMHTSLHVPRGRVVAPGHTHLVVVDQTPLTLTATIVGAGAEPALQWYHGNTPLADGVDASGRTISGATTAQLTMSDPLPSPPMIECRSITPGPCPAVSECRWDVSVECPGITVTQQPSDVVVGASPASAAVFEAAGTAVAWPDVLLPVQHRWRRNGELLTDGGRISGAQSAQLTVSPPFSPADAGVYECELSIACRSVRVAARLTHQCITGADVYLTGLPLQARHTMVHDHLWGNLVAFGGFNPSAEAPTVLLRADGYSQVAQSPPDYRTGHASAYDPVRRDVVMFGGLSLGGAALAETWTWNGGAWALRTGVGPSARSGHAMAFDGAGRLQLYGGRSATGQVLGDAWHWNGQGWSSAGYFLGPVHGHTMTWAPGLGQMVMFGGVDGSGAALDRTWILEAGAYLSTAGPPARHSHASAFDAARQRVVIAGGVDANGVVLADVWEWDGRVWTQPGYTLPQGRYDGAMAYSDELGCLLYYGGMSEGPVLHADVLALGDQPLRILRNPLTVAVLPGGSAELSIHANALGALTYRWHRAGAPLVDGERIAGAGGPVLTINTVEQSDAGVYTCLVQSACESRVSEGATLIVVGCGPQDFNGDGDFGTDQDIEAFFACLGGACCPSCWPAGADFDGDGDTGTDQDIEAFFNVLGGGSC